MAVIGAFGDVLFEVSNFKIVTLDKFKRDTKGNYAEHKRINQPAILEFLGRELEEISFSMTFSVTCGVNPFDEVQKFREMVKKGEYNFLIIGNHAYGENPWIVEDISETVEHWSPQGKHWASSLDARLREYIDNV